MKILITGGAGFIGSSIADRLLDNRHHVLVIDNYKTGKPENNKPHKNLIVKPGSIADEDFVYDVFSEFCPEVVIHAAASYKEPYNWQEDILTNISGTVNIINASKKSNITKLIYLQTSLCYGLKPLQDPITINHPLFSGANNGGSSYAISKTSAELYIELSGLDFISLRLANVYGPKNLSGPLATFFYNISNNISCKIVNSKRDFIFINDVVNVIEKAIFLPGKQKYYHVSTAKNYSIKQMFELVVKHVNANAPIKIEEKEMGTDDVKSINLDPLHTETDFNWKALTLIEEGVKITMDWYKANPILEAYTHLKNI